MTRKSKQTRINDRRLQSTIGRGDFDNWSPRSPTSCLKRRRVARCQILMQGSSLPPVILLSTDEKHKVKRDWSLTIIRRFQLSRRARHHLPIVLIVRSSSTASMNLANSRYGNRTASDDSNGLHPCRPHHTAHTQSIYLCRAKRHLF